MVILFFSLGASAGDAEYLKEIQQWRQEREERLRADDGYLTIAGLFWLRPGENSFGSDPSNDFVLPAGSTPARVGTFHLGEGGTRVVAAAGVSLVQNGETVQEADMTGGLESAIGIGGLTLWVHFSGERAAIRLRDQNSPIRKEFKGLNWYPIREEYRVEGRFVAYPQPREVRISNVFGDSFSATSPGLVTFSLHGREVSLQPTSSDGKTLFFVFRDRTSGRETYGAARFLYAERGENDRVVMDFNKAYNPPCAFNPYTTCPLPVRENRLSIPIQAGELDYH